MKIRTVRAEELSYPDRDPARGALAVGQLIRHDDSCVGSFLLLDG